MKHLEISGISISDQIVVKNAFKLVEARGIPLDVLLTYFQEKGILLDWRDFIPYKE